MKKVIRLTESDLMRIVKRVINESEGEDTFETLINLGLDNTLAFYITMVEGNGTWTELFNMYGKETVSYTHLTLPTNREV